jgi:hypothetical protein
LKKKLNRANTKKPVELGKESEDTRISKQVKPCNLLAAINYFL